MKQIENKKRTSFTISSIPVKNLKEFKEYCKEECGDIYYVGIIQLLKTKKQLEEILTAFHSLQSQLNEIKEKNNRPRVPKTFGP